MPLTCGPSRTLLDLFCLATTARVSLIKRGFNASRGLAASHGGQSGVLPWLAGKLALLVPGTHVPSTKDVRAALRAGPQSMSLAPPPAISRLHREAQLRPRVCGRRGRWARL